MQISTAMRLILCLGGALSLAAPARAEIAQSGPSGFKVKETAVIAARPDAVWARLIRPDKWWLSAHTWSGSAKNLRLEAKPGGCWCEAWGKGAGAHHMTVVYVDPGKELRLSGALGPLQAQGVAGAMVLNIAPTGDGSLVTMTYTVGGFSDPPLDQLAAPVDHVLGAQLAALKASLEGQAGP